MKIVMCASEALPFAKTGGLADVCGSLPLALEKLGVEVTLFLPRYRDINKAGISIEDLGNGLSHTVIGNATDVYFVGNDEYFDRKNLYGDSKGDFIDNLDRFKYFCEIILISIKKLGLDSDIIHCNDWQTALIPVLMKEKFKKDEYYSQVKTVLTIHNLAYQGVFPIEEYKKIGFKGNLEAHPEFEFYGKINLLKAGILYSDRVTTVSKQYSREIMTEACGSGLEGILRSKDTKVKGILNGIDYDIWNPRKDGLLLRKYSQENYAEAKAQNKEGLQKILGLKAAPDVPLFGFVGRISHQKGVDLIIDAVDDIIEKNIQLIIQGVGEKSYQKQLKTLAKKYPEKVALCFEFNEKLAHWVYAGSDFFLMPSNFEPCGLSQMISFCFGTVPIVFRTGGLADTVMDIDQDEGNGFVFNVYNKNSFVESVQRACSIFHDKKRFEQIINNAFEAKFSWDKSAKKYKELYSCLLSELQVG